MVTKYASKRRKHSQADINSNHDSIKIVWLSRHRMEMMTKVILHDFHLTGCIGHSDVTATQYNKTNTRQEAGNAKNN